MTIRLNEHVAGQLEEVARLLRDQGAGPYRVNAYLRAARSVRRSAAPVDAMWRRDGLEGLMTLPGVGDSIARAIRELLVHGQLPMLERLRGAGDAVAVLATVPGVGRVLAERLHADLGLETLSDVEAAAHDGRLASVAGFGEKRLAGIRDSLAHRLGRLRLPPSPAADTVPVAELLAVDREYREKAAAGQLRLIAPRRFNPTGEAWLPVLHTARGARHYTALYSNTARAHKTGMTRDWVVLYHDDGRQGGERQHTVITAMRGPLAGHRIVAGREAECEAGYAHRVA
ncbi:MAG TPA: helix-hairpin-helix domain-containing protein [Vicinamibacterales bacterium]|nr:helix-hairpin-helix domain-containing protein [Vicinamibacterales bacterium]